VRRVACRLILDDHIIRADKFAYGTYFSGSGSLGDAMTFVPSEPDAVDSAAGEYLNLLSGEEILAQFTIPKDIDSCRRGVPIACGGPLSSR